MFLVFLNLWFLWTDCKILDVVNLVVRFVTSTETNMTLVEADMVVLSLKSARKRKRNTAKEGSR